MVNKTLCNQLLSRLTQQVVTFLMGASQIKVRPAQKVDIEPVTDLIHSAFQVWIKEGLRLSPMVQTIGEIALHLVGGGFVAVDKGD